MEKVLIIDRIEDIYEDEGNVPNPVIGKLVTDKAGEELKVKGGQGGKLFKRWGELQVGRAYSFTMGEFKPPGKSETYPFVRDFKAGENEPVKQKAQVSPPGVATLEEVGRQPAPQEKGMWWKEMGEMMRCGDINVTTPFGASLRKAYYAQMFASLQIDIKGEKEDETSKATKEEQEAEPDKQTILLNLLLKLKEAKRWKDITVITKVASIIQRKLDRDLVVADIPASLGNKELDAVLNEIGALL